MFPHAPVHGANITRLFIESSLLCSGGGGSGAFLRLASGRTAARHTLGKQQSQAKATALTSQASGSTQGVSPAGPLHHCNTCTAGAADPPRHVIRPCGASLETELGVPSSVCRVGADLRQCCLLAGKECPILRATKPQPEQQNAQAMLKLQRLGKVAY